MLRRPADRPAYDFPLRIDFVFGTPRPRRGCSNCGGSLPISRAAGVRCLEMRRFLIQPDDFLVLRHNATEHDLVKRSETGGVSGRSPDQGGRTREGLPKRGDRPLPCTQDRCSSQDS